MSGQPAVHLEEREGHEVSSGSDSPWVPISRAAGLLRCNAGALRRRCARQLAAQGLARQIDGQWHIHCSFDPRLRVPLDRHARDLQQIAELLAERRKPRYIEIAQARRDVVLDFHAFRLRHSGMDPHEVRRLYLGHLQAERIIGPGRPIRRVGISSFYGWQRMYDADGIRGLLPQYNRPAESRDIGEAAWGAFLRFRFNGNHVSLRQAYKLTAGLGEMEHAGQADWRWPSYQTVLRAFRERVSPHEQVLADEGPYKFAAKCLPKITRSLEETPAGSHLCGDERILDFQARVPRDRSWVRCRLILTAFLDVRSRFFAGWHIGQSANSDTILASFKSACETMETLPDEVTIDNGKDYRAVAGRTRRTRKWAEFDSKRISSAFERLGVQVHYAIIRHPWSKIIESRFHAVAQGFDKFFASYWGGRTDQRPWDAEEWNDKNIELLPTEEEVRDAWTEFLTAFHGEPVHGDGAFDLSPRELLRRFFTDSPRIAQSDVLALACCRMHGPIKVGRDGVRLNNIIYGKLDQDVWAMQGQSVYLLADPVNADRVTLCDQNGVPICTAWADRNLGMTSDEVRAAEAQRRRATKTVRNYPDARDFLMETTHQRIAQIRQANTETKSEAETGKRPPAAMRVVRPDIAAGAERMKRAAGLETMRHLRGVDKAAEAVNRSPALTLSELLAIDGVEDGQAEQPARRLTLADLSRTTEANDDAPR